MKYIVSWDVGQAVDPSAIAVLRRWTRRDLVTAMYDDPPGETVPKAWFDLEENTGLMFANRVERMDVVHLERFPLKMRYPEQVQRVKAMMGREPLSSSATALLIDKTGVGRPVLDSIRDAGWPLSIAIGIMITSGSEETRVHDGHGGYSWHVPKISLVSALQSALHHGQLRIAPGLPDADVLKWELSDFRASTTEGGGMRFGARSGRHDDLVLAVAQGVWYGMRKLSEVVVYDFII